MSSEIVRDERGHLIPGSKCIPGAGRWKKEFSLKYFRKAQKAVTPDEFEALVKEIYQIAMHSPKVVHRIKAAKLLLDKFLPGDWQETFQENATEGDRVIEYSSDFVNELKRQASLQIHKQASKNSPADAE